MNLRRIAAIVLAVTALAIPLGAVLAKDLGKVVISGPGLKQPIEITDHDLANQFGLNLLDNLDTQQVKPPADAGTDFYTIDRGFRDEAGTVVGYDHVRYYPAAGLFQFMGTDGYESKYEGAWFEAPAGKAILIEVLAEHGVKPVAVDAAPVKAEEVDTAQKPAQLEVAEIAPEPVPVTSQPDNLPLLLGGVVILMLVIAAGLTLARSRRRQIDS